jgi:hypothetical protein
MNNLLDIKPGITATIIGTLYKEMRRKPCILKNLVGVLKDDKDNYCTEDDYMVLEDSSGRIRLKKSSAQGAIDIHPGMFVTGSIMGFLGRVD